MFQLIFLSITTLYQLLAVLQENKTEPPGERFDLGGFQLHLYRQGEGKGPTIVLDHSLGGVEGYAIVDALAELDSVCIYDRAGYGWSDPSPNPRNSANMVAELDQLLTQAEIQPPYILIGDSLGSYNMRLYAAKFPEKIAGLVLTDGLHESQMLKMPIALKVLQLVFLMGFWMAIFGSSFGIVRLLRKLGVFEWMKPELRDIKPDRLNSITRSFCRPKHWITMSREIWSLGQSGQDLRIANDLGDLPIVNIKSQSFFKPVFWTAVVPTKQIDRLRDHIHDELLKVSTRSQQIPAETSSHFVWIDQPEVMIDAVKRVMNS